ncbi:uncharacterized protein TNCT_165091 [Trichonephila clavata]|uniref:Uncharacterized protein n=1 Tax=Trichonephila clavata TaxID=2740835 RepID=A0A8X6F2C0_TRICU|nr:uncharacterized protein TNCT_165091 [Trichonephila clavata]
MCTDAISDVHKTVKGHFVCPLGIRIFQIVKNIRELLFEFVVLQHCKHDVILGRDFLNSVINYGWYELFLEHSSQEHSAPETRKLYAIQNALAKILVSGTQIAKDLKILVGGNRSLFFEENIAI